MNVCLPTRFAFAALVCLSALPLTAFGATAPPAGGAVSFNRDIRPILSDNCFYCHGPDSSHRKAGLRLDTEAGLFGKGENGPPVVRGKPDDSEVWRRITTDDADDRRATFDTHAERVRSAGSASRQRSRRIAACARASASPVDGPVAVMWPILRRSKTCRLS